MKRSRPAKATSQSTEAPLKTRVHAWVVKKARIISLLGGTAVVILWTLIRHISNGVNYDVVGQIGLAQQWAHGYMAGTQLGATNYIFKIPVYILVNTLDFITPMDRLLLLAVVFNVATFILLFILCEKIMNLYEIKRRSWLYLAMAWLATIAGNVFWVDYANSRNLETVGGVLFIYLVLKYMKKKQPSTLALLAITGSIVFFADSLQFYVCGVGVCLFALGHLLYRRTKANVLQALAIIGSTVVGYLGSLGLFQLATKFLHVTFFAAPNTQPALTLPNFVETLLGMATSTLKIFGADFLERPYAFNSIRELLNAVVLVLLIVLLFKLVRNMQRYAASVLVVAIIAVNYLVYVASGQVMQWETSRYLIMAPLLTSVLLALNSDKLRGRYRLKLQYAWLLIIVVSSVMLLGALAVSWPDRHSKDTHIGTTLSFLQQQDFRYALSSREVGITTSYFGQGKVVVLPMGCGADHTLEPTNLFYDNAMFKGLYDYNQEIPVIIPTNGVKFGANTCTQNDVMRQFGIPKREIPISEVGTALVYNANSLRIAGIDALVGHPRVTQPPKPVTPAAQTAALPPLEGCKNGTVEVVVAHTDDDLLLMNPALSKQLNKMCVRSVFVTAADDGRPEQYWRSREFGIKAAYASMLNAESAWTDSTVIIDGHTVSLSALLKHPSVGLVFLHLPDGNVNGKGFARTGFVSLEALASGKIPIIQTVDRAKSYTYPELIDTLSAILVSDKPSTIFTSLPSGQLSIGDHSDHRAVGGLTMLARTAAKSNTSVSMYIGYPSNGLAPNLSTEDASKKMDTFYTYAKEDNAICISTGSCSPERTYENYFSRSYKIARNPQRAAANKTQPTPSPRKKHTILDLLRVRTIHPGAEPGSRF